MLSPIIENSYFENDLLIASKKAFEQPSSIQSCNSITMIFVFGSQ
jgi:hypothetical protein